MALLAALVVLVCGACWPASGWAQNTAEKEPPPEPEPTTTDVNSAESSAENTAEATATEAAETVAEQPADATGTNATATTTVTVAETPSPEPETERSDRSGTEVIVDTTATDTTSAGNVVESTPTGTEKTSEFTPALPGGVPPIANAAESRASATGATNRAEGTTDEEDEVAIPPEPDFQLPSPAELAGAAEDYQEPTLSVAIPPIQFAPELPSPDSFVQPERAYLERRPLPPVEDGENAEERAARSIEESLQRIDLAMEQRPESGVTIPLPSGLMTFKASDSFQYDRRNRILTFSGNVELLFSDIAIWADLVEVDDGAATAYAKGYVAIQQGKNIVYCDEAYLNYDTQTLEMFWIEGNTSGERLYEPLYFEAERAYGTFDHLIMEKALITTCPPLCGPHRDYEIKCDKMHYRQGKSVVMYDAYLFLRDDKVAWIPMLAVPIPKKLQKPEERSDIQQTYGWNKSDGLFAKFAYTYSSRWVEGVNDPIEGGIKTEFMTERGAGVGVKQEYFIPSLGVGLIDVYYKDDWPAPIRDSIVFRQTPINRNSDYTGADYSYAVNQDLKLSRAITGSFKLSRDYVFTPNYSTNSQNLGTRKDTWDKSFALKYNRGTTNTNVSLTDYINSGGTVTAEGEVTTPRKTNRRFKYDYSKKFTKELGVEFRFDRSEVQHGATALNPVDKEGSYSVTANYRGAPNTSMEGYNIDLTYNKSNIDFDGDGYIESNTQISNKLPSLSVKLPNDIFDDNTFFNSYTITAERLISGRRGDPDLNPYERYALQISGSDNTNYSRSCNVAYNLGFNQYFYSDGNALYQLNPRTTLTYNSHDWYDFKMTWNMFYWQGARAGTAENDRRAYRNNLTYNINMYDRDNHTWKWTLGNSYDFQTWRFATVSSNFTWDPNDLFGMTFATSIGPRLSSEDNAYQWEWNQSRVQATWRSRYLAPDGYRNWTLGSTYAFTTDFINKFKGQSLQATYSRRLGDGWVGAMTMYYSYPNTVKPAFSKDFLRDAVRTVWLRKINCCTTWEALWRRGSLSDGDEIWVKLYLNALPQYPGYLHLYSPYGVHRPALTDANGNPVTDDNGDVIRDGYFPLEMDAQFHFDFERLRTDVLTDVLGGSLSEYGISGTI
ncbi:hypothetical protein JW859_07725 [bacterium]|nr:hypothetical protein [bacterium]